MKFDNVKSGSPLPDASRRSVAKPRQPPAVSASLFSHVTTQDSFRIWPRISFVLLLAAFLLGADSPGDAVQKVRAGLAHFRGGEYSEAETAFDEASEISPENATIKFDKACAALAGGDADQARGLFQAAASAKDAAISVRAHYNLGCLEADQARAKLGDDPAAAVGEVREDSIKMLLTSVRHYRDVLNLSPQHRDARHNLELIRLFIKHIQSQWAERDRQRDREEKDLLQFVVMLEEKEAGMRTVNRRIQPEPDGVQRRQVLRENADAQRLLQEEIEPLKKKIAEAFSPQPPQPGQPAAATPPQPDEQQQEALEMMNSIADEIGSNMLSAANATANADLDNAIDSQTKTLDLLNQLYMIAAPYDNILQRSIQVQTELAPTVEEDGQQSEEQQAEAEEDDAPASDIEPRSLGIDDVESQGRVSDWSRLLPLKAEAMLPQVQQQLESLSANLSADDPAEDGADEENEANEEIKLNIASEEEEGNAPVDDPDEESEPTPEEAQAEQLKQQVAQLEGLAKSMELAIELAPQAEEHSQAAAEHLKAEKVVEAGTEQQETLRILKEIAEPLKNDQNQDQQQNNDQQDQQNDEQQEDQEQQQNNQDQQQQDQNQSPQDEQQQQEQREQEAKQQQAESVLQQARERERKHREDMKKIRAYLMRGMKVDKDW